MSRPRKPTWLLEDIGAFRKDPQRRRARGNEPASNGPIGEPPSYFDPEQCEIWYEFVSEAAPGVLKVADRMHLELTVRLMCKMRIDPVRLERSFASVAKALVAGGMKAEEVDEGIATWRSELTMTPREMALLANCLAKMGKTPSGRSQTRFSMSSR